jgi:NAD(P)-dependent dehydrogenase (short-subunit alcohol dehydrogenase family)
MGRVTGKVAIVTGAGSGIGRATALLLAAEGASVGVADVRGDAAKDVAKEIDAAGGEAIAVQTDVSSASDAARMVKTVTGRFGGLHVLYNNAGVDSTGDVVAVTEADWDRCFAVNVKGTYLCSQAAVSAIAASGGGAIVNQASVAALAGVRNMAAYCAAKGAIVALTRSMAVDLADRGIRVNAICPGTIHTPLMEPMLRARGGGDLARGLEMTIEKYPIGRLGRVEDVAHVALFLASDDAAFVTGAAYPVDGGMTAQ